MLGKCEIMTRKLSFQLNSHFLTCSPIVLCPLNCMQVTNKFILRQYDSAAILIVYLPIFDDMAKLDMLKQRNFLPTDFFYRKIGCTIKLYVFE